MSTLTYIDTAALLLSLISLFLVFFLRSRMVQLLKIIKTHSKRIEVLEAELSKSRGTQIFNTQSSMPVEPFIQPPKMGFNENEEDEEVEPVRNKEVKPVEDPESYQNEQPTISETPQNNANAVPDRCAEFVNEFNILHHQSGIDSREAFINKFNVIGISCVNASIRMEQPEIPPEFAEISPVPSGEYWACEIEPGTFAVVPNIKTYTERYHIARAMSQVFKSKFVVGNTYNLLGVKRPAFFTNNGKTWTMRSTGELALKLIDNN